MPNLLCIDTSSARCSVALCYGDEILQEVENTPQKHSERVLEMCDALLNKAGIHVNELDTLGISQGPGSFTGVRIGVSVAQGIAFAARLPIVAVSSLALLAQQTYRLHKADKVLCLSDARMGEMYFGAFSLQDGLMTPTSTEGLCAPGDYIATLPGDWVSCGSAWSEYADVLVNIRNEFTDIYTDIDIYADNIIPYAKHALLNNKTISPFELQPVYLRNKVAEKAKTV